MGFIVVFDAFLRTESKNPSCLFVAAEAVTTRLSAIYLACILYNTPLISFV